MPNSDRDPTLFSRALAVHISNAGGDKVRDKGRGISWPVFCLGMAVLCAVAVVCLG